MTKIISICLLGLVVLLAPLDAGQQSHENEEELIKKAVEELYIKGLQTRDFGLIETVCIPEAHLMSAGRDGELHDTTLEKWSKRFDPNNPPFKKLDYSIVKIDREGSAAQVRIAFTVDSSRHVTDFLHMLKLGGEWRIVNIIDF
jgi:hypothetical protein